MNKQSAPMSLADLQQRSPTQNRWENLEVMYTECTQMFGVLAVYPQQARVLEPEATEEERQHLQRILKNLETDCRAYKAELDSIRANHLTVEGQPRKGIIYDTLVGEDLFQYTSIGASYRSWMEGFQALTLQPADDFSTIAHTIQQRVAAKA